MTSAEAKKAALSEAVFRELLLLAPADAKVLSVRIPP